MFYEPVAEVENLRADLLTALPDGLSDAAGELSEVLIEFESPGRHELVINGIDASFTGKRARIFTDRNFNEMYIVDGLEYRTTKREAANVVSTETTVTSDSKIKSLKIYRLNSIWN